MAKIERKCQRRNGENGVARYREIIIIA